MAILFGAERALAAGLHAVGWGAAPASVVGILGVGAVCAASPAAGAALHRLLGPASVWMKAALPLLLVPPIAAPLTAELPASIMGLVAVAVVGLTMTPVIAGRLAWAGSNFMESRGSGANGGSGAGAVGGVGGHGSVGATSSAGGPRVAAAATEASMPLSPVMQRHAASAASMMRSTRLAIGALVLGSAATALAWFSTPSERRRLDSVTAAPALIGLTTAIYVASAAGMPKALSRFLPPTVCSGVSLLVLISTVGLAGGGGAAEVRREASVYMDGAGTALMVGVPATMLSLGLMVHTHRQLLLRRLAPVLVATAVGAPLAFVGTALIGSRLLGVPSDEVASMIPGECALLHCRI